MAITMEDAVQNVFMLTKTDGYGIDLIGIFRYKVDAEVAIAFLIKNKDFPFYSRERSSSEEYWKVQEKRFKEKGDVGYERYKPSIIDMTPEQIIADIRRKYDIREVILGKILDGETLYSE